MGILCSLAGIPVFCSNAAFNSDTYMKQESGKDNWETKELKAITFTTDYIQKVLKDNKLEKDDLGSRKNLLDTL